VTFTSFSVPSVSKTQVQMDVLGFERSFGLGGQM
jgi:hypothetical protein